MKKVRNSLTWFSHGSGAASAPSAFGESVFFNLESGFDWRNLFWT